MFLLLEMVRIISVQFHNSALLSPSVLAGTGYFSRQIKFHPRLSFPTGSQSVKFKKAISFILLRFLGRNMAAKPLPKAAIWGCLFSFILPLWQVLGPQNQR